MDKCVTGKRVFRTREAAEDALLVAWTVYEYTPGSGPVSIYQCDECGGFHFTSRGPVNERLDQALKDGSIHRQREAKRWEGRFRKNRRM